MSPAVTRQERHPDFAQRAEHDAIAGRAERRIELNFVQIGQPVHLVEARASDDGEFRVMYVRSSDSWQ